MNHAMPARSRCKSAYIPHQPKDTDANKILTLARLSFHQHLHLSRSLSPTLFSLSPFPIHTHALLQDRTIACFSPASAFKSPLKLVPVSKEVQEGREGRDSTSRKMGQGAKESLKKKKKRSEKINGSAGRL